MWSRRSTRIATPAAPSRVLALAALLALAGCASAPHRPAPAAAAAKAAPSPAPAASAAAATSAATQNTAVAAPAPPPPPPAQAVADFGRAVGVMRAGNVSEAELEFQQIALDYPQLAGPDINLGILYRKSGQLDLAEKALREAVERNAASAVAWNELGVTLRMRGRFQDAADAYRKSIAVDPNFAPAYRNLGVLLDLYLGDAPQALAALEHYKQLAGEDRTVTGWIAELRHRTTKAAGSPGPTGG